MSSTHPLARLLAPCSLPVKGTVVPPLTLAVALIFPQEAWKGHRWTFQGTSRPRGSTSRLQGNIGLTGIPNILTLVGIEISRILGDWSWRQWPAFATTSTRHVLGSLPNRMDFGERKFLSHKSFRTVRGYQGSFKIYEQTIKSYVPAPALYRQRASNMLSLRRFLELERHKSPQQQFCMQLINWTWKFT